MQKFKCPYCGGELDAEDGLETFYCKHCGGKILMQEQSNAMIDAKVRMKELELEKFKMQQEAENRKTEAEIEDKNFKQVMTVAACMIAFVLVMIYVFYNFM